MNILITGCAGFIGSHYTRHLLSCGHTVIGVDNLSGGYLDNLPKAPNFIFIKLDLEDREKVVLLFKKYRPEVLIHLAAYAAEGLSPFIRNFNYRQNLLCAVNLINECVTWDTKFIFTSSMSVYGDQTPPFTEDMRAQPLDPYAIAKYAVELDLQQAHHQFELRYNIVRPHNVFGIRQNIWDPYRNVIGNYIRKALSRQPILIFGNGTHTRAFSDIRFYMDPFDKLLTGFDGGIFNLGSDKFYSLNEVARIVQEIGQKYGYSVPIEHAEARIDVRHAYCDHTKAKTTLGFEDHTNLPQLIEEVFVWAMSQPLREVKERAYEVTKGIYPYWK